MAEPTVVPRAQHTLSRRDIDPDALKVLYRLHHANYLAYLVGGSVRDLLLGRRPKDFDIGTDAHPYQVKRLFRNCWIIGRRFRLAHVKFGMKTIEVATFRRQVVPGTEAEPPLPHADAVRAGADDRTRPPVGGRAAVPAPGEATAPEHLVHRDNTFGTPEEDAFRRDFTVNALFYDVATFSVIDYVGGLEDLQHRVIRSIGDPEVRFREDPVRMLRAVVLGARLGFSIDPAVVRAIDRQGRDITLSAPARLMEEYFKILRSGSATRVFRDLGASGLLQHLTPEIPSPLPAPLEQALEALDRHRARFDTAPESLTNAILLGTVLVPLGLLARRPRRHADGDELPRAPLPALGALPVARRDVERLGQILSLQRRLRDLDASPRAKASLLHRHMFAEALTWLEIHGEAPDVVAHWRAMLEPRDEREGPVEGTGEGGRGPVERRRRRRRRRRPPPRE